MLLSPVSPAGTLRRVVTTSTDDISGTGTATVTSGALILTWPEELMATPPTIIVSCSAQVTGGTGAAYLQARMNQVDGVIQTTDFANAADGRSGRTNASTSARQRHFYFRPDVLQSARDTAVPRNTLALLARGENSDTAFSVTNITARLVYEPLL